MIPIRTWIKRSLVVLIVFILLSPMLLAVDLRIAILLAFGGFLLWLGLRKVDFSDGHSVWDIIPSREYVGIFGGFPGESKTKP